MRLDLLRRTVIALCLGGFAVFTPTTASADNSLLASLGIPLLAGATAVACAPSDELPPNAEYECIASAQATDANLVDTYRNHLFQNNWILIFGSEDRFIMGRWISTHCEERLYAITSAPGTLQFAQIERRTCGNARYRGDTARETHPFDVTPPLVALSDELLFPGEANIHRVASTPAVNCASAAERSHSIRSACVQIEQGMQGARQSATYLNEISQDQWIFTGSVTPILFFSRWQSANCQEMMALAPAGENMPLTFSLLEPMCGAERAGQGTP